MSFELTYRPFGERAMLIEWPSEINKKIWHDIISFKTKLEHCEFRNVLELNISYSSLLVVYSELFNLKDEIKILNEIYKKPYNLKKVASKLWKIPVCYDKQFGIDLELMSKEKGLSESEIIARHSKAVYSVYFIGFLPGFLYLGGLDESIYMSRKSSPRLKIEKGSVAIGGNQTGVYPNESPGGWNIIGNSPISFFNASDEIPCFAQAGDVIKFYSISTQEHAHIKILVDAGVYQLESEVFYD